MDRHDYVRHTLDCLQEAQVALILAERHGQIDHETREELERRIEDALNTVEVDDSSRAA